MNQSKLDGRELTNHAVVTGSAGGVGKAVITRLKRQCGVVWALDTAYAKSNSETVSSGLTPFERNCTIHRIRWDATKHDNIRTLWERLNNTYVNWVVNCMGVNRVNPLDEVTEEEWDLVVDTNLKGPFFTIQACIGAMRRTPLGLGKRIVNLVSIAAQIPHTRSSAYNASKAGLRMLVKQLGRELAPEGIIVSGVSPCIIDGTGMTHEVYEQLSRIRGEPVEILKENYLKRVPGGRHVNVTEVADAVMWLLSPEASYCIGTDLEVSGGMM